MADREERAPERDEEPQLVVHDQRIQLDKELVQNTARVTKRVQEEPHEELVPRNIEDARVERVPAQEADSGRVETLPDGSISIPLLEERLVVTKEVFVRERLIVRKETATENMRITETLRREHAELEIDD